MDRTGRPKAYSMDLRRQICLDHILNCTYKPEEPMNKEEYSDYVNEGISPGSDHAFALCRSKRTEEEVPGRCIPKYLRRNDIRGVRSAVCTKSMRIGEKDLTDDTVGKMLRGWVKKQILVKGTVGNVRNISLFYPNESFAGTDAFLNLLSEFRLNLSDPYEWGTSSRLMRSCYADVVLNRQYILHCLKKAGHEVTMKLHDDPDRIFTLPYLGTYRKVYQNWEPFETAERLCKEVLSELKTYSFKKARVINKRDRYSAEYHEILIRNAENNVSTLLKTIEELTIKRTKVQKMIASQSDRDFEDNFEKGNVLTYLSPEKWIECDPDTFFRLEAYWEPVRFTIDEAEQLKKLITDKVGKELSEEELDKYISDYTQNIENVTTPTLCCIQHSYYALMFFYDFINDNTKMVKIDSPPYIHLGNDTKRTEKEWGYPAYHNDPTGKPYQKTDRFWWQNNLFRLTIHELTFGHRTSKKYASEFFCFGDIVCEGNLIPSTLTFKLCSSCALCISGCMSRERNYGSRFEDDFIRPVSVLGEIKYFRAGHNLTSVALESKIEHQLPSNLAQALVNSISVDGTSLKTADDLLKDYFRKA